MHKGQAAFDARFATELKALSEMGSAAGVVGSTFVHRDLGIAFDCPGGWTLRDLSEVEEAIRTRRISRDNDLMNEAMRETSAQQLPLVVVAAPTLDDPIAHLGPHEITPHVTLMHESSDTDAESSVDLLERANMSVFYQRAFLQDYRLLQRPERTTLSGCDAVVYSAAYTGLFTDTAEEAPFRERTYYFRRGRDPYTIRMGDFPDRDPRLAFDFKDVVSSICLR